jgi:hypothetical protein
MSPGMSAACGLRPSLLLNDLIQLFNSSIPSILVAVLRKLWFTHTYKRCYSQQGRKSDATHRHRWSFHSSRFPAAVQSELPGRRHIDATLAEFETRKQSPGCSNAKVPTAAFDPTDQRHSACSFCMISSGHEVWSCRSVNPRLAVKIVRSSTISRCANLVSRGRPGNAHMSDDKFRIYSHVAYSSPTRTRREAHEHAGEDIRLNSPNVQVVCHRAIPC